MRAAMLSAGFRENPDAEGSDFLIINTCSFIREAQEETIEAVFQALSLRDRRKSIGRIGMVGCFVQRFEQNVREEIPEVDFLVGTGRFHELPYILSESFGIELLPNPAEHWDAALSSTELSRAWSYFRIAQGCSRACAFCILPVIRGKLTPYTMQDLQRQYNEEMTLRGGTALREVILVSQDTISSGVDELERIIAWFSEKPEIEWIRLQYLFPDKRVLKLLDLYRRYPKLVPYLDIPFQHVSPAILRAMNRPDDPGLFREILNKAKDIRNDMEFRTSFILGFPGETPEDFSLLQQFLQETPVHKLALFRYSHEQGSPAEAKYQDVLADEEKVRRINLLREVHLKSRKPLRESIVGRRERMLVEETAANGREITARRATDSPEIDEVVFVPVTPVNRPLPGEFVHVEITGSMEYDWVGELTDEA